MEIQGLFHLQLMMFLLMGVGFFLRKNRLSHQKEEKC